MKEAKFRLAPVQFLRKNRSAIHSIALAVLRVGREKISEMLRSRLRIDARASSWRFYALGLLAACEFHGSKTA